MPTAKEFASSAEWLRNFTKGNVIAQGHIDRLIGGTSIDFDQETLLSVANHLVYGDRAKAYGPAKDNMERIAELWSTILGKEITWQQVVMCMVALKLSRLCFSPDHENSWRDIAGFAGVWDKARRGE